MFVLGAKPNAKHRRGCDSHDCAVTVFWGSACVKSFPFLIRVVALLCSHCPPHRAQKLPSACAESPSGPGLSHHWSGCGAVGGRWKMRSWRLGRVWGGEISWFQCFQWSSEMLWQLLFLFLGFEVDLCRGSHQSLKKQGRCSALQRLWIIQRCEKLLTVTDGFCRQEVLYAVLLLLLRWRWGWWRWEAATSNVRPDDNPLQMIAMIIWGDGIRPVNGCLSLCFGWTLSPDPLDYFTREVQKRRDEETNLWSEPGDPSHSERADDRTLYTLLQARNKTRMGSTVRLCWISGTVLFGGINGIFPELL